PVASSPDELRSRMDSEIQRWASGDQGGEYHTELGSRFVLHVLDIGERNSRCAFPGVVEDELIARHEDLIAVEILGATRIIGLHEISEALFISRRNPARKLELRLLETDVEAIFLRQTHLQNVKLQGTDNADKRGRTIERTEDLNDPLLRHLLERFLQLLRLHGIAQLHAAQNFRREIRHAEKRYILAFRQRVADTKRAVIGNADHIAGIGFIGERTILGKKELRGGQRQRLRGSSQLRLHPASQFA